MHATLCLPVCTQAGANESVYPDLVKIYQCVGGTVAAERGQREKERKPMEGEAERNTACGLSLHCGLTLLLAHRLAALHGLPGFGKWQVASTLQGIALGLEKRWIRSRCTVPLGLKRFKLKAQYSFSRSIGAQTGPQKEEEKMKICQPDNSGNY